MAPTFAFQQKKRSLSENKPNTNQIAHLGDHGASSIEHHSKNDTVKTVEATKTHLYVLMQTSLDLKELLTLFKNEIESILAVESCHYQNRALDLQISLGDRKRHNCTYRLLTQDDYLGELVFTRKTRFSEAEIETLETLICTTIYPIRNALRYREAMHSAITDALTGAGNRVSLNTSLGREYELAKRYNQPLSLLMIDLDHFKGINDQFGHAAGDRVLQQVAREIQQTSRCADMTFRYGGEEFVVLLNKTDKKGAEVIAERIRVAIENLNCVQDQARIPITTSIGCTTLMDNDGIDDLLHKADKALYVAKSNGRNQVCLAD